jgi:small subunit ribosomal protein S6e
MPFKINIGTSEGKTYKLESEAESLIGKKLGEKIDGKDISADLSGYEFELKGASDKSGFMSRNDVEGVGLKKILVTYGKGMKKKPRREGKKKQPNKKLKGLKLRKTFRGNTISENIAQINLKLLKEGTKKLSEIFPEQNKTGEEKPAEEKQNL